MSNTNDVKQEAVLENPSPAVNSPAKAKVEIPTLPVAEAAEPLEKKEDDGIVRIASKEKNLRARIGYCLTRLTNGNPVTLQAYGQAVNKAILMSSIVRTKVGDVHMVTKLETLTTDKRETQGVTILLSKDAPADTSDVGYQAPEPKGFWVKKPRAKKEKKDQPEKKDSAKPAKSEDKSETKKKRQRSASRRATEKADENQEGKASARRNRSKKPKVQDKATSVEKPARDRKKDAAVEKQVKNEPVKEKPNRRQRQRKQADQAEDHKENKPRGASRQEKDKREASKSGARKGSESARRADDQKSSGNQSARRREFQKSWADDADAYFYEGAGSRKMATERTTGDRDRDQMKHRPRGGGYGNVRRPPMYASGYEGYPPMRGPYFPNQGYYMMPARGYGGRYYNQPGYQKGAGTREIGASTSSHGGHQESAFSSAFN